MHKKTTEILNHLKSHLLDGTFGAEFLHSERNLERELGLSRTAVRSVLAYLEHEKWIFRIPGKGLRINRTFLGSEKFRRFMTVVSLDTPRGVEGMLILAGIAQAASEKGAEMVLSFDIHRNDESILEERLSNGSFDGLIFLEEYSERLFRFAQRLGIPAIIANQEEGEENVPSVKVDYRQIGSLAARHLLEKGHRNIGFISLGKDSLMCQEMVAGIKESLTESGVKLNRDFSTELPRELPEEARKKCLRKILRDSERRPTAFISARDSRTKLFYDVCEELGLRIPQDISVISYDNISWRDGALHGLTTIEQPVREIGHLAFDALFEARTEGKTPAIRKLPGTLLDRGSVREI